MKVGSLMIEMAADLVRLRNDLNGAVNSVDRAMRQINAHVDKVKKALGGLAAGFVFNELVQKLVSVQREFDVLNSSLKTVTGSSAAAAREMAWIKQFAKETPFGLAQATEGFVKMMALGLNPTKASLTSFGNTASAMGKNLMQMIEAVADASTGEFERLKEFGIKAKKDGDKVSLTFQGVTTTIKNSSAEITKYLESIGNVQFAGAMAERAKTLDGAIAELGDTWDELFRTINSGGIGDAIAAGVRGATTALEWLTENLSTIGLLLTTGAVAIGTVALIANFGTIVALIGAANTAMWSFLAAMGPIGWAVAAVAGLTAAYLAFKQEIEGTGTEAMKLGNMFSVAWEMATGGADSATDATKKAGDASGDAAKNTVGYWEKAIRATAGLMDSFGSTVVGVGVGIGNVFMATSDVVRNAFATAFNAVAEAAENTLNSIIDKYNAMPFLPGRMDKVSFGREKIWGATSMGDIADAFGQGIADANSTYFSDQADLFIGLVKAKNGLDAAGDAAAGAGRKTGDAGKAAKKAKDEFLELVNRINGKHDGVDPKFFEELATLYEGFQKGRFKGGVDEYVATVQRLIGQQQFAKDAVEASNKAWDEYFDTLEKARLKNEDQIKTAREMLENIQFETKALKMTNKEREVAIAMRELERNGIKEGTQAYTEFAEKIRAAIVTREETKAAVEAQQAQLEGWKSIDQTAHDVFVNVFEDGAGTFKRLGQTLKASVLDVLYQMTVKRWIINIAASLTGQSLDVVSAALGGGSGGSGALGLASNGMSAYNLFTSANWMGAGGFLSGMGTAYGNAALGTSLGMTGAESYAAAQAASIAGGGSIYGSSVGAAAGSGTAGGLGATGSAAWAALPVALAALGWFGASYFDKGDTYSGAAYASSGGNDPSSVVRQGLTNFDPVTGDLPDRDALITQLLGYGANSSDLAGVNDRSLLHLLRLAENEQRMERDGGPMMSWDTWIRDGSKDDFYRGPGYANPEALNWWDNDPAGGYKGSMDYLLADPAIVKASRALSEGILAPLDSISQALGLESDFRVTTGMARNDKTGNIFGGLAIQNNGQEVFNSGKQEFDSQGEYLRATFANTLEAFDSFDLPQWAQTQADDAKKRLDELKPGDTLGSDAATIYSQATSTIAATIGQISSLIKIVPELGGASQDAVYNIGQAMGTLDNFVSTYGGYVQNFYTEAERFDYIRAGINDTLSAFDIGVTADTTREQFRALVEAQDLTTESGQKTFAALMQVSAAFAEITPVAEVVAQVFEEMAQSIGSDLTGVLTEGLLGNLTGADLGGQMADVVIGGVYNALAGNAASQISSIMTEGLITPLLRAATTNAAVSDAVTQASIDATVAKAKEAISVFGAILNDPAFQEALKEIDGAIRSITASMPSTPYYTSYQSQVKDYESAVKDSATEAERAAEAIRKSWSSISDSLLDEVRKIRGELADAGDQSMAYWQSQFAMDSTAARAGDEEAAKRLTGISGSLLDAAGREAASMLELQQMRAWVAQSLQDTAGYAAARGSGALTTTTSATQTYVPPPLPAINQAPIVVSANNDKVVAKLDELTVQQRNQASVMADMQVQMLRIVRRWDQEGMPEVREEA